MTNVSPDQRERDTAVVVADDMSTKRRWTSAKLADVNECRKTLSSASTSTYRVRDTLWAFLWTPVQTMTLARRRKLTVYLLVFIVMVFLSSILDVRRAAWRQRKGTKLELLIPSSASSRSNYDSLSNDIVKEATSHDEVPPHGSEPYSRLSEPGETARESGNTPPQSQEKLLHESLLNNSAGISHDAADVSANSSVHSGEQPQVRVHANLLESSQRNETFPNIHQAGVNGTNGNSSELPPSQIRPPNQDSGAGRDSVANAGRNGAGDRYLSAQELKDDVDQLIAHVDEENSKAAELESAVHSRNDNSTGTSAAGASSDGEKSSNAGSVGQEKSPSAAERIKDFASNVFGISDRKATTVNNTSKSEETQIQVPSSVGGGVADTTNRSRIAGERTNDTAAVLGPVASNSNHDSGQVDIPVSTEELFHAAHRRLEAILNNEKEKAFVDENDLRLIQALGLQATRGNCEQLAASEGGSLFKSDAEAASSIDIERSDPLWGAWCMYMGTYKSDAMKDFVAKLKVLESNIYKARADEAVGIPRKETLERNQASFDAFSATLDDVMGESAQTSITGKLHYLRPHLQENELRYIAALSLQASFGDCGTYGKELSVSRSLLIGPKILAAAPRPLRQLTEPLTGQTAIRREGALWGAWCALQGKDRHSATNELSDRTELLLGQLARSQSAARGNSRQDGENLSSVSKAAVPGDVQSGHENP